MTKNVTAGILAGVLLAAGCATGPAPLTMEDTVEVSAAVSRVDAAARVLTIRTDAGNEFTLDVAPEVRNLPQVQAGDRVVVRYREALGAAIRKKGDPATATVDLLADRAQAGETPGASVSETATVPVRILGVDAATHVVTFLDPDGLVRTLRVRRPDAQAWVRQLNAGDEVVVTYTESLALAVEPAAR